MSFPSTHHFLAADGFGRWLVSAAFLLGALGLWAWWFVGSEITLTEQAVDARLESAGRVHAVETPVGGRIAAVQAYLGQQVAAGDLLFALDADEQRFDLTETEARLAARRAQLTWIAQEIAIEEDRLRVEHQGDSEELAEAQTRLKLEQLRERYARTELEQSRPLHEAGLLSTRERLRLQSEAEKGRVTVEAQERTVGKTEAEQAARKQTTLARLARLRHEVETTRGEIADLTTHAEHLRHDIAERTVRAPVAGRLGWLAERRPGGYVEQGERLAEIVPAGDLRAVAYFPPAALGHLRPGQPARLRLDAFPWTQFGVLRAQVARIATEAEAGKIRAELALEPDAATAIPLQHGLTGQAEVEVERVSPALLVLRSAGGTRRASSTPRSVAAAPSG